MNLLVTLEKRNWISFKEYCLPLILTRDLPAEMGSQSCSHKVSEGFSFERKKEILNQLACRLSLELYYEIDQSKSMGHFQILGSCQ